MTREVSPERIGNRWLIAIMGTGLQLCLGTVYAWSFFQNPLVKTYSWSNTQVAWIFSIAICFLGIAAAWGGMNLARYGPRKLAILGGILFGAGYLIAAAALSVKSLWLLYLGYGVIGGIGLGLGYVTPVATAAKWFPDRKGLVTGMVVMGFGFGALLMSKVLAPRLVDAAGGDLVTVFACLGVIFLALTVFTASFLKNPPAGWAPAGYSASGGKAGAARSGNEDVTGTEAVFSGRFAAMWLVFFCNIVAGIAIISFQSPLMQDLMRRKNAALSPEALAAYGATLIAVSSLFNGAGRFFWGAVSDRLGRVQTFRLMLATQIAAFVALVFTGSPWFFGALVCYILLCYGGGFGTMPSFVTDVFGQRIMPVVYGVILTAWAAGGIVGPQVFAQIKDAFADPSVAAKAPLWSFAVASAFLVAGLAMALLLLSNRPFMKRAAAEAAPQGAPE